MKWNLRSNGFPQYPTAPQCFYNSGLDGLGVVGQNHHWFIWSACRDSWLPFILNEEETYCAPIESIPICLNEWLDFSRKNQWNNQFASTMWWAGTSVEKVVPMMMNWWPHFKGPEIYLFRFRVNNSIYFIMIYTKFKTFAMEISAQLIILTIHMTYYLMSRM